MTWRESAWAFVRGGPFERWIRAGSLWVSLGEVPRVHGSTPMDGGLIVFPTHSGDLDASELVFAIPRPVRFVVAAGHEAHPILAALVLLRGDYLVERSPVGATTKTLEELDRAAADARSGQVVVMFPQGGERTVQAGAAWFAARAGVPVVPIFCYRVSMRGAVRRAFVRIHRPVAPPSMRSSERRAFGMRWQQRMTRAGASRPDPHLIDVVLDNRELWRDLPRVVAMAGRVQRLSGRKRRNLDRRARLVRRACRRLRCSPDSLRHPPGPLQVLGCLVGAPLAAVGLALCAPPLLLGFVVAQRVPSGRRMIRNRTGVLCAVPWTLVLLAAGLVWPLVPVAAGVGLFSAGLLRRWGRAVCSLPAIHWHRARFLPQLDAIERGVSGRDSADEAASPALP